MRVTDDMTSVATLLVPCLVNEWETILGNGGVTDLTEKADNLEGATERLATDRGSKIPLAILIVDTDQIE